MAIQIVHKAKAQDRAGNNCRSTNYSKLFDMKVKIIVMRRVLQSVQ
jgi:hypothetical protein